MAVVGGELMYHLLSIVICRYDSIAMTNFDLPKPDASYSSNFKQGRPIINDVYYSSLVIVKNISHKLLLVKNKKSPKDYMSNHV